MIGVWKAGVLSERKEEVRESAVQASILDLILPLSRIFAVHKKSHTNNPIECHFLFNIRNRLVVNI